MEFSVDRFWVGVTLPPSSSARNWIIPLHLDQEIEFKTPQSYPLFTHGTRWPTGEHISIQGQPCFGFWQGPQQITFDFVLPELGDVTLVTQYTNSRIRLLGIWKKKQQFTSVPHVRTLSLLCA